MINFEILNTENEAELKVELIPVPALSTKCITGNLTEIFSALNQNTDIHFVSNGDFSLHELINSIVYKIHNPISITFSSFSLTELPTRYISDWKEKGLVKEIVALVDVRAKANYPGVFQQLQNICSSLAIVPVHAKVTILESAYETVTLVGSANWTTNKRYETGLITMNPDVAGFHKAWIIEAINKNIKSKKELIIPPVFP